jgi:hypothetical protein
MPRSLASPPTRRQDLSCGRPLCIERLCRFGLWYLRPALLARSPRVVVPKVEHGLTEMLDDVAAIEIDVFNERATVVAIENHMFMLARRTAPLDYHAERVGRTHWRVRNIRRNEKRFALAHEMIDDAVAFTDPHFDVALQLVEILFRIDEMKIVSRVWAFDDHHKEIAAVVEITVAHWRLEQVAIFFDPLAQVNGLLYRRRGAALRRLWLVISSCCDEASLFPSACSVKRVERTTCHGTAKTALRIDIYS